LAKSRLAEAIGRCADVNGQLKTLVDERRELITSDKLQRAMLLQRNWKAMRDDEWEDYLAEVCRTLGAKVERTGRSGDQGVDLVVEFGDRRIAVQAKGYYHVVNSAAVQQAVAGMAHYRCNACAAITNSRFTPGAKELAASNRCTLISEDEFPDFVMGKFSL
jgi:HJR/Mrr/RecB family endonuclease